MLCGLGKVLLERAGSFRLSWAVSPGCQRVTEAVPRLSCRRNCTCQPPALKSHSWHLCPRPGQKHQSRPLHSHSPGTFSCTQSPIDPQGRAEWKQGPAVSGGRSSCESSICSPDPHIAAKYLLQLESWPRPGHARLKVWFRRCLDTLNRALPGPGIVFPRSGLKNVSPPTSPGPAGQPWTTHAWEAPLAIRVEGKSGELASTFHP